MTKSTRDDIKSEVTNVLAHFKARGYARVRRSVIHHCVNYKLDETGKIDIDGVLREMEEADTIKVFKRTPKETTFLTS
jgi:hypothetical protein